MWRFDDFVGSSEHRVIGSSEFKRNLYGCFGGLRERKMFWSSEDRVKARFHYAESRQNKP